MAWWNDIGSALEAGIPIVGPILPGTHSSKLINAAWQDVSSWLNWQSTPQQPPQQRPQTAPSFTLPAGLGGLAGGGTSGGGYGGGGAPAGPGGYYTPDGHFITNGSSEDSFYKLADAAWTKIYGQHAPYGMVQTFHSLGVQNTEQLDTIMRGMPSHILDHNTGNYIPLGQYNDIKGAAQSLSDKYLGRPIPDSLIQQFVDQKITSPEAIDNWFYSNAPTNIPKDTYGAIYDAASVWTQQLFNDLPGPSQVSSIYNTMGG